MDPKIPFQQRHELYAAFLQTLGFKLEVSTTFNPQQCTVKLHSIGHPSRCLNLHTQQHAIKPRELCKLLQKFTALPTDREKTAILNNCLTCLHLDEHDWHYHAPIKTVGSDAIIQ